MLTISYPASTRHLLHFQRRGRGRHARDEDDEDAELLRDEEADGGASQVHRLQVQPSILTGGTLREYQLQGLNWLIHLYDNGINGILADEMVRQRWAADEAAGMKQQQQSSLERFGCTCRKGSASSNKAAAAAATPEGQCGLAAAEERVYRLCFTGP
jgi:hypothetical protein